MAANLTSQDFETLIGINSMCKTRWTSQWQGNTSQQSPISAADSPPPSLTTVEEQQRLHQQQLNPNNPVMTIDHQQLQQWQILSHLQVK